MKRNVWILVSALAACAEPAREPERAGSAVAMQSARLWRGAGMKAPAATAAESAVTLVERLAPRWGAPAGTATLAPIATLPMGDAALVRIAQSVDGVEVDGGELRVLVSADGALLAASGVVVRGDAARDRTGFALAPGAAVARAVEALHGVDVTPGLRARSLAVGDEAWFAGGAAGVVVEEARARKRWHRDGDVLVPAWVVEAYTAEEGSTDSRADRVVIAARDGRVLTARSLIADAFRYRVWAEATGDLRPLDGPTEDFTPHPTGMPGAPRPPYIAPSLVEVEGRNHPAGGGPSDPWLPATATETAGNNVDAYTDVNAPGGLSEGDFRGAVSSPGEFGRLYDTSAEPLASTEQQHASIAQLFYAINWLHDDWYDAGFTEAAGNGQAVNYGRGGVEGDVVLAEAQDGANDGNRNNANMATPGDGMSPRMQVYLWTGTEDETVTAQPGDRAVRANGTNAYGPREYTLSGTLLLGDDAVATTDDGCEALPPAIAGRIVLLARGNCSGKRKALNAQNAGAIGAIISHNVDGFPPQALPDDGAVSEVITIPVMSMSFADGAALRTQLAAGPVTVTLAREVGVEHDGALDTSLVAHELGHYIHHRLSECGTRMCGAMSEGWADFIALLTMARPGDDLRGAYAVSGYAAGNDDPYFGIRRAPYSVDTDLNAFTYRLVADGETLPSSHPVNGGGPNSEVHNAGEIWAGALWEGYVALQEARGSASFEDTRKKMQRYIVAGLLLAPPDGTFTEIRDAILAAVQAQSPADHDILAAAYARRGLGSCAISPTRNSSDFIGAAESFEVKGHALAGPAAIAVDIEDCDGDGTLDVGETATLTLPVVNAGALALSEVGVSVTSATPGLTVLTAPAALGALAPYADATTTFQIRLDEAVGPAAGALDVTVTSPGGCADTQTIAVPVRLAADDRPAASATDTFDAANSPWDPRGLDAALAWHHESVTALDRVWHGTDLGVSSDTSLVSPPMTGGSGVVTIAFDHAFEFEFSDQYYDGGVIEISFDDGATWQDASTLTTVPYNATIGADTSGPLAGMPAFSDRNPSWPARDRVTLDFDSQLARRDFRLRFRIGTDPAVGATGWIIDNLAVTGLAGAPFPIQGPDDDACDLVPDDDGGCCSTGGSPPLAPIALVAVALLVRRRRPRAR